MERVPDDWPYADEPRVCAACGSDDDRYVVVDSLGLVWGAAMDGGERISDSRASSNDQSDGGLEPTALGDYSGTLEFRCCEDCWTDEGVEALDEARTLLDQDAPRRRGQRFVLDDEKVTAAAKLDARRVAVGDLRRLEFRSDPEREHVRAQDEAVEAVLDARFDRE